MTFLQNLLMRTVLPDHTSDAELRESGLQMPSGTNLVRGPTMNQPLHSEIEFRYSLGDLCLFRLRFRALVSPQPFDPAAQPLSSLSENPEIPKDVPVILYGNRPIAGRLPAVRTTQTAIRYIRNQRLTHYIDLRSSFQDYLKQFSAKRRGNIQREVRKLAAMAEGTMQCREFRSVESMGEYHMLARQVAAKTYQEKLFGGAIPGTQEFLDKLRVRTREDALRGYVLIVKGQPISYICLPIDDGVVDYQYLGYDPDYAEWSPGTVLLYLALERLFAEGTFRYFNLSYGEGQMKKVFGRATFLQADVYFFRRTVWNASAVYGHAAMDWFSRRMGCFLERLGLRKRMRKLLRRLPQAGAKAA
jgi:CelD/BcsL family acetyltransferase involved in cellulose biosynthesis